MTQVTTALDNRNELVSLWSEFSKTKRKIFDFIRRKSFYLKEVYHSQTTISESKEICCTRETTCRLIGELERDGFIEKMYKKGKTWVYTLTNAVKKIDFHKAYVATTAVDKSSFLKPSRENVTHNVTQTNNSLSNSLSKNDTEEHVDNVEDKIVFSEKENEILEEKRKSCWIADERFLSFGTYFSREMIEKWKRYNDFDTLMATFDLLKAETQRRIDKNEGLLDNAEAWFQKALMRKWAKEKEKISGRKERNRKKAFSGIKRFVRWVGDHYAVFQNGVKLYFNEVIERFDEEFENQKTINTWGLS